MPIDPDLILPPGKLPNDVLVTLLERYVKHDSSVIVGPGIGRDAAAIEVGDRILVLKTDPITFATADAGRYLVHVNANDIACMGATPRWLLVTALFPERYTTPRLVESIFASLADAAAQLGIALVGGHSEIAIGVDRPLLIGQMVGETDRKSLPDPSTAHTGDGIMLANGIAIEGTAILAREAADQLTELPDDLIDRARALLDRPGISVIPAVSALRGAGVKPRYLHDPTEGGLATALRELAVATHSGIEVDRAAVPILPETEAICSALGLDPLGLIASGALLAVVGHHDVEPALEAWHNAGITAARVGRLVPAEDGCRLRRGDVSESLPTFDVDEIARFFACRKSD